MDKDKQRWHAHQAALYLDHVKGMGAMIKALSWSIEELEAKAEGVGAMDYSKDQVQTSPTDEAMPNNVDKLIQQKQIRERKKELYEDELAAVTRAFERMPNITYAAMLEMHYVGGASWMDIADELGYSKAGVMKNRQKALAMFYDVMPPSQRFVDVPKAL